MPRKKKNRYNDNNLAVAYYRYSSRSQDEETIATQRKHVRAYAKRLGLELVREYKDEAKSGRTVEGLDAGGSAAKARYGSSVHG